MKLSPRSAVENGNSAMQQPANTRIGAHDAALTATRSTMERRLQRSRTEKLIGGVCSGLGAYFDVDPVLVRIAFVVLALLHGVGIIAYIICWIAMPAERSLFAAIAAGEDPAAAAEAIGMQAASGAERTGSRNRIAGGILVALGVLFLIDSLIPSFHIGDFWPVILIVLGVALFASSMQRSA
jgi:phage shock protein PspC (stress-responsive transcriptional regulator)